MAGRRPVVILALTLLVLPELVLHASGKPIPTMAHGPKGDVEFETLTLNASDFWDGVKTGQRVTISGELLLPTGTRPSPFGRSSSPEMVTRCPSSSCRMAAAAWGARRTPGLVSCDHRA